jgi:hypothetical protein
MFVRVTSLVLPGGRPGFRRFLAIMEPGRATVTKKPRGQKLDASFGKIGY